MDDLNGLQAREMVGTTPAGATVEETEESEQQQQQQRQGMRKVWAIGMSLFVLLAGLVVVAIVHTEVVTNAYYALAAAVPTVCASYMYGNAREHQATAAGIGSAIQGIVAKAMAPKAPQ